MAVLKEFYCDQLHTRVFATRSEMGICAGQEIAACIKTLLAEKETINMMFAAAPSQNETLQTLCADPDIDWSRIHAFHMDEYIGLEPSHSASFRNYLTRTLFSQKPFGSIHLIEGDAADTQGEIDRYDRLLRDKPIDICVLGVGENGHIAFNDPPVADFKDEKYIKVVELDDACRLQQVHDGCFPTFDAVPTHAMTVTIPGLVQARYMFCVVPAATKAEALQHLVQWDINERCPATILRTHAGAKLYADADSGKHLL